MAMVRPMDLQDAPVSLQVHQENKIAMSAQLVIDINLVYLTMYYYYKISKNVQFLLIYHSIRSHHLKMTRREVGEKENLRRKSWSTERTLNDRRINSDCVTESAMLLAARALLFQPKGKPGTELSTISTMFWKMKMLSE